MMIDSKDISVVIQGAVDNFLVRKNVNKIREIFPKAEIIISTWKKSNVSYIDYDKVIFSKDPGGVFYDIYGTKMLNMNRMLLSTQRGINAASRKYVLKCRSDLQILSDDFLKEFEKYPIREEKYALASHKMIVLSLFSLKYEKENGKVHKTPFHISDWCCFGLKSDLMELFNVPLVKMEEYARYFKNVNIKGNEIDWQNERLWRFPPEQYIMLNYAKRKLNITMENCMDTDHIIEEMVEKFIVNNFIILDPVQFRGVCNKDYYKMISEKLWTQSDLTWNGMYRNAVYQQDYKKYCDSTFRCSLDYIGFRRLTFCFYSRIKSVISACWRMYCRLSDKIAYGVSPKYRELRKIRRALERR